MAETLCIKDWKRAFGLKESVRYEHVTWTKFPVSSNSSSYRKLMQTENGRTAYCVFVALIQLIARKKTNGIVPEDYEQDLMFMTGMPTVLIAVGMSILRSEAIGWVFERDSNGIKTGSKRFALISSSSGSSPDLEESEKPLPNITPSALAGLVNEFPPYLRDGPLKARKAAGHAFEIVSARNEPNPLEWLRGQIHAYLKSPKAKSKFSPHAAAWFQDGWYDNPDGWKENGDSSVAKTEHHGLARGAH